MEAAFLDLMPHTVTLQAVTQRSVYGVPTLGTGTDVRALVVIGRRRVVSRDGQDLVARGVAYCAGPTVPGEDGAITIPASFGYDAAMPILAVTATSDETGAVHNVEVAF